MPDLPDYYRSLPSSVRFPMTDSGELAARLGSPMIYDRRGEFIWCDTFDFGVNNWTLTSTGSLGSQALSAGLGFQRPFSLKLSAPSSDSSFADIIQLLPNYDINRTGVEVAISHSSRVRYMDISIFGYKDGVSRRFQVRLDTSNGDVSVLLSDNSYFVVGNISLIASSGQWFAIIKVVGDWSTNKYARVLVNSLRLENLDYECLHSASVVDDKVGPEIRITSTSLGSAECYIGHVIFTANEP